jgi:hypothetical protein
LSAAAGPPTEVREPASAGKPPGRLPARLARGCGCFALGSLVALVAVEGLSSVAYLALPVYRDRAVAERQHTRYDPDLGWINIPRLDLEDLYGPKIYFQTNSQSFRSRADFPTAVPAGKLRVLCSGDSFTLGSGVDNDHAWCQLLATLDRRLEPVNMGEGGYGVDQAFLRYRRDGTRLEHHLHLFAFITEDFHRMERDQFLGYGKPLLRLDRGALVTTNVPVPRHSALVTWLARYRGFLGLNLAAVKLVRAVAAQPGDEPLPVPGGEERRWQGVAGKIVQDLAALNRAKGSRLLLIFLPTITDYSSCDADSWRRFMRDQARALSLPFVDLVESLRQLPPEQVPALYLDGSHRHYFGARGHYSAAGNAWVAREVQRRLAPLIATPARETPATPSR